LILPGGGMLINYQANYPYLCRMKAAFSNFTGQYVVMNGDMTRASTFSVDSIAQFPAVYEVIRLIDRVPLFIEDHFQRLENSARLLNRPVEISLQQMAQQIQKLSTENKISNGNIRIMCAFPGNNSAYSEKVTALYFIPHKYPAQQEYEMGISMQTLFLERPEPNAKLVNSLLNEKAYTLKEKTGVDEVLLVTHEGLITEGSKSNIFFVDGDKIITAHGTSVLRGITREKVFEICNTQLNKVEERQIFLKDISKMNGAFITGTSPKVMPVRRINEFKYDISHPAIINIMNYYDELIFSYIKNYDPAKFLS
jgi:branched-chain amino acid aminotransferase